MKNVKDAFEKAGGKMPSGGSMRGAAGNVAKIVFAVGGLAFAAYGVSNSIVTVQPGHLGIVYERYGGLNEVRTCGEGMNFIVPWFQRAIVYNVRTRPQLVNSVSGSKDLQMVQISLRVLVRPDPTHLQYIYRTLGQDYDERVLPSIVNEITKAVIARFNASELLTKRDFVSKQIRDALLQRAADFKIIIEDVSVTHLSFGKEYTAAVEAKQVAQQDAERGKYVVEKAIQEKRRIVIRAEGEAKSAELIGKAIQNNPAFIQLRRIETARDVAQIIAASTNKVFLNADTLQLNQLANADIERGVRAPLATSADVDDSTSTSTSTTGGSGATKLFSFWGW